MEHITLQQHIEARIRAGIGRDAIKEQLLVVGWPEEECDRAYAAALIATGVPTPLEGTHRRTKGASTLDIVLNFFSFILLGIVATALGTLFFQIINKYFPDALARLGDYYYSTYPSGMITEAVYYAIAALVVAYPLYYVVVWVWFRRFRDDEGKVESKLTKWLTYLVLLAASVTIVGDLIAIIFTFLQGEITVRFFLKALTILVIAGVIFGFYFLERRKVQYHTEVPRKVFQWFGYTLTGVVLAGIVLGFVAAGSPATERKRAFDERRAQDLQQLAMCVSGYAQQYERLPVSLDDLLRSSEYSYCEKRDSESGELFEYRIVKELVQTGTETLEGEVELCGVFALPSSEEIVDSSYRENKWYVHEAGRDCDIESVSVKRGSSMKQSIPGYFE
ncbi:MAG: hypothetical protein KBD21_02120 [Candidatus Pacebacteria bacterium]|nr:hypothetical protein [Candidatus Paceibacterota bacterium]